jgi:hypothetical protein
MNGLELLFAFPGKLLLTPLYANHWIKSSPNQVSLR